MAMAMAMALVGSNQPSQPLGQRPGLSPRMWAWTWARSQGSGKWQGRLVVAPCSITGGVLLNGHVWQVAYLFDQA